MRSDRPVASGLWAIVVTYNRKALLIEAIQALRAQTLVPAHILIVDNASADGTPEALLDAGITDAPGLTYLRLADNLGGAGGFASGMKYAYKHGALWTWSMDDDAFPAADALEKLLAAGPSPLDVHASVAGDQLRLAWPIKILNETGHVHAVHRRSELPTRALVENVPFLGLLVHRDLVDGIGLPDAGFFIAADDTEFCVRARRHGASVFVVGESRIYHPLAQVKELSMGPASMTWLDLPPWKRYYDTRNRLLIARRHYGHRLWIQTLPGSLIRLVIATLRGPKRMAQCRAAVAGIIDGLRGLDGRRHEFWKIHP